MSKITIDGPRHDLGRECEPILRSLPEWFGIEESIVEYVEDIDRMPTFATMYNEHFTRPLPSERPSTNAMRKVDRSAYWRRMR